MGNAATPQTVTITNTGNATATSISSITVSDSTDYSISSNTCSTSLTASSTCHFSLGFTPLSSGSLPATITVTYTGTGSPLIITISGSGGAGSYYVQSGYKCNDSTCSTNASTLTFAFTNSQISGDLNVCKVGWYDQTTSISSVSSSNGNTYNPVGSVYTVSGGAGNVGRMLSYVAIGVNSGLESFTVNFSASANDPEITCGEYSGINAVDVSAITNGTGTAMSSGNVTTTSAADVLVGFNLVANATSAPETGWTQRYLTPSGNILEDFKPGTTGTFAATATQGQAQAWIMQIIALKPGTTAPIAPSFSPAASFYWLTQSVTLTASGATKIVYTTDGTIPSVDGSGNIVNGNLYSTPVSISATARLQAIAWNVSGASPVSAGQYNIGSAGASTNWPLKASITGTYLTDQSGTPLMLVGDSPWTLMCSMTPTLTGANSMGAFFSDRKAHGFNAIFVQAIPSGQAGDGCSNTNAALDGTLPFTACIGCTYPSGATENNYNYADANTAYFAELDSLINIAAAYNLTVVLGTFPTTGVTSTGTITEGPLVAARLSGNSCTGLTTFGEFLGTRYKNYGNIVWFTGEDFQDWPSATTYNGYTDNQLAGCVATGVATEDTNHLMTEELNYLLSYGNQNSGFSATQTANAVYSYDRYDEQLLAYNSVPRQPNLWIEGYYEYNQVYTYLSPFPAGGGCTGTNGNIPPVTSSPLYDLATRMGQWGNLTSGALGGVMYGSCVTGDSIIPTGWPGYIDTPGASQIPYLNAFWAAIPWTAMVPDQTHNVVTAGYGTYQAGSSGCSAVGSGAAGPCNLFGDNYVTTLWNPNGTIAVVYVPGTTSAGPAFAVNSGITVALSKFAGNVTAQWFDPTSGAYTSISGSPFTNTGTHSFTPPSLNTRGAPDWVLLLQATATIPVQTLTAPTFSPVGGIYASTQTVTLADATGAATICYTINGSTPTTNGAGTCVNGTTYSTTITVAASETIKAIATANGYNDSPVSVAGYTINGSVGTPVVAVIAGMSPNPQTVSITSPTLAATICYKFGSAPTTNGAGVCTSGTSLVNGGPLLITSSVVLYAIGTENGYTDSSVSVTTIFVGAVPMNPPTVIILL